MKLINKIKKSPIILYTIVFSILMLLFCILFLLKNKTMIWVGDGIYQHYSILYDFNEKFRSLIKYPLNGFSQWSWAIGYGSDVIGTYAYYVLGDPFAYLSLLVPMNKLPLAYNFLIVLRLYFVGVAFIVYAKKMRFSKYASILGSVAYAFSGFVFMIAIRHPYFINPLILLPLVFICIENILENKRKYLFSIVVAITIISNFYFCYMIALISILYAFLRYFEVKKYKDIKLSKYLINLIFYGIIGALISAIILAPTLYSVFTSSRIVEGSSEGLAMNGYPVGYYINEIYSLISTGRYPYWTILTCPIVVFIFIPLFIKFRKKYSTIFYMSIIFLIMTLFPIFGYAMNGFESISNRWTFVFAFITSCIIAIGFDNLKSINKKDIIYMGSIVGVFIVLSIFKVYIPSIKTKMFPSILLGILIIVSIIFFLINNKKHYKMMFILILSLLSVNIVFNNYYRYSPNQDNYINEFLSRGKAIPFYKNSFDGSEKYIKNNDSGFYRIGKTDNVNRSRTRNNSLVLNYNGIDSYLSVNNGYLAQFSKELSNRSFTPNSPIINFDNRPIVSDIMGVKYYVGKKDENPHLDPSIKKVKDIKDFTVYEKKDVMPFGYVYSKILSKNKFDSLSGVEKETSLVYAASVDEKYDKSNIDTIPNHTKEISFNTKNSTAKVTKDKIIVTKPNEKVELNINNEVLPQGNIYVNIDGLKYNPVSRKEKINNEINKLKDKNNLKDVLRINSKYFNRFDKGDEFNLDISYKNVNKNFNQPDSYEASGYFTMNEVLFNLGYYNKQQNNKEPIVLTFENPGEYTYKDIKILSLPTEKYNEELNKLKKNSMKIISISDDKVLGSISTSVNGVITFQIPYSKGWTLKIDNKKVETFPVNTAFLGANIDKGKHKIELTYKTPLLRAGAVICYRDNNSYSNYSS